MGNSGPFRAMPPGGRLGCCYGHSYSNIPYTGVPLPISALAVLYVFVWHLKSVGWEGEFFTRK